MTVPLQGIPMPTAEESYDFFTRDWEEEPGEEGAEPPPEGVEKAETEAGEKEEGEVSRVWGCRADVIKKRWNIRELLQQAIYWNGFRFDLNEKTRCKAKTLKKVNSWLLKQ